MSSLSPNIAGNVVLKDGAAWTAGKPYIPAMKKKHCQYSSIPSYTNVHTYVVTATESKNGSCLVACDTLLDFEHIAVEIWTGAVEQCIHEGKNN